jgi:hypothetical protein
MAVGSRATTPAHSDRDEYVAQPPPGRRIGIALSGGGVRSAAFNLGALQALQEEKVLATADYVAAVSGGNYIASAWAISHAYAEPGTENGRPLWSHGSPEERYLRRSTNYIAPGHVGRTWMAMNTLHGFVLNYLPFLLCAFIGGRLVGWLTHWSGVELDEIRLNGLGVPGTWIARALLVGVALSVLAAVVVVALRRYRDGRKGVGNYGRTTLEPLAAHFISLAGLVLVLLVLPVLANLYGTVSRFVLTGIFGVDQAGLDTPLDRIAVAFAWLLLVLAVAVAALVLSNRWRARRLMLALSAVAGTGLLLVPLLSSLEYSARYGLQSGWDVAWLAAAVLVVALMAVKVHNRRYSMHLFYRERLNSAFAIRRFREPGSGEVAAGPIPYQERLHFSKIGKMLAAQDGPRLPKLVVCCAVNVTSDEVPVGRFAESFTFEHDVSGGPRFAYCPTETFEQADGPKGTDLTLPSIMAVSGAALSPVMGRFTYPPLRFLMALINVRLGVWIRNPRHPGWDADAAPPSGRRARFWASIKAGWREPGALYVLREALGGLTLKHRFVYLSDGGHWENLGVVELLRRRCTDVLCFDASSDPAGSGHDLGRAVALARSELGAGIDLDPGPVLPGEDGMCEDTGVRGEIRYPDQQPGRIVYAKAAITSTASWDLRAFRARDPRFPHHATSQQIFTDEQFEAYRSLGHAAGKRAVELLNLPSSQLRNGAAHNMQVRERSSAGVSIPEPGRSTQG